MRFLWLRYGAGVVRLHPERLVSSDDGSVLSSQPLLKLDPYAHLHLDLLSGYLSIFSVISSCLRSVKTR